MLGMRDKLRSESGASMIMALLLMLVVVVTSAVIVSAATSSALSIEEDRDSQQAYLTVSSAAELMRDELESGKCNYTATTTQKYTRSRTYWGSSWGAWSKSGDPSTKYSFNDESALFTGIMKEAMDYITAYSTSFYKTYAIEAGNLDKVSAEVMMGKVTSSDSGEGIGNYNLTVTFDGEQDPHKCKMKLTMEGIATTSTSSTEEDVSWYSTTQTKTEITTTTVEWKNAKIQRKEVQ